VEGFSANLYSCTIHLFGSFFYINRSTRKNEQGSNVIGNVHLVVNNWC